MKSLISLSLFLFSLSTLASELIEWHTWHHLSPSDGVQGVRTEETYSTFGEPDGGKIIVAVLDSGVDITHEDLEGKIWLNHGEIPNNGIDDDKNGYIDDINGWDFISNRNDVIGTDSEHGTLVAGIIAANRNNNIGVKGIASNVILMPLRVIPEDETVEKSGEDLQYKETAEAVIYAVNNGVKVINMSFGWEKEDKNGYMLESAIRYAETKGVLIVQAAGNETSNIDEVPNFPMRFDRVTRKNFANLVVVGSTNRDLDENLICPFSNYGKNNVDIFAPGMFIRSTAPGNEYDVKIGTSLSAPMVSGAAALLLSFKQDLSAPELRSVLLQSARRFPGFKVWAWGSQSEDPYKEFSEFSVSGGILDVFEAVSIIH